MNATRATALTLLLLLATVAAAPFAQATDNNPGTIKVHDESAVEPPQRNQPHVTCEFWIEGFNMADSSGTIEIRSWAPTGDGSIVLTTDWSADAHDHENGGFHFLSGPFTLPEGHYRVEVFSSTGHPGGNPGHFAKAKMFWVDPCPLPPEPLPCPPGELTAVANADGSVTLSFTPAPGSDGTNVYRLDEHGEWEFLGTVDANTTTFTDTDTEVGVTYTYTVTALFGDRESIECEIVEVTTIPEFPTGLALGLAAGSGLLAYAFVRRRKQA